MKMTVVGCPLSFQMTAAQPDLKPIVRYGVFYSKTCLKRPLKKKTKIGFNTEYRLMQVKSNAECSKRSILQYFRPSLSYHLSLAPLFCLFSSGGLRQVLLYF